MKVIYALTLVLSLFLSSFAYAEEAAPAPEQKTETKTEEENITPQDPMQVFIQLAEDGDARAQFILGDLYVKGRNHLEKNDFTAKKWFEKSAAQGYWPALIRLAAIEKRLYDAVEAYKWYTLAMEYFPRNSHSYAFAKQARRDLDKAADLRSKHIRLAKSRADEWQNEFSPSSTPDHKYNK